MFYFGYLIMSVGTQQGIIGTQQGIIGTQQGIIGTQQGINERVLAIENSSIPPNIKGN